MRCSAFGLVLVSFLLSGYFSSTPARAQPAPQGPAAPAAAPATAESTDETKANELFLKGKALFADGKLEEAYETYKAAFGVKKRYDIAGNLGNAAFELGKMRDAAEYLSYCVRNFPPGGPAGVRAKLEKVLNEARKRVGTLSISVADKNCQVYLDGKPLPGEQPPAGPVEVVVDPGSHTIEVKRAGFKPTRQTIQADAGSRQELAVQVPSIAERATPIRAASSNPDLAGVKDRSGGTGAQGSQGDTDNWKPWAIGGGAVLAATGIGIGIGFTFMSNAKGSEGLKRADELVDSTPSSQTICGANHPPANQAECDERVDLLRQRDTTAAVAVAGYAVGGAALIGTVVLAVLPRKAGKGSSRMHVTPVVSRGQGALVLTGSF